MNHPQEKCEYHPFTPDKIISRICVFCIHGRKGSCHTPKDDLRKRFDAFNEESRKRAIAYGRLASWEKRNKELFLFIQSEIEKATQEERSRIIKIIEEEARTFSRDGHKNRYGDMIGGEVEPDGRIIVHYKDTEHTISDFAEIILSTLKEKI